MKRLVFGLSLAMVFGLAGGVLAAEPDPTVPSQDLQVLEAAIFQVPQEEAVTQADAEVDWAQFFKNLNPNWKRVDHCVGPPCGIFFCTCAETCEACGGVLERHCNPYVCTCNMPGCT